MVLSLRLVISTVSVLLVVIVAAVTLTMTLTSSIDALRSVGQTNTLVLLRGVETKTQALFSKEFAVLGAITELVAQRRLPWPSDDPSVLDRVFYPQLHAFIRLLGVTSTPACLLYFWDNTRVSYSPYNATHYHLAVLLPSPVSARGGLANQTMSGFLEFYHNYGSDDGASPDPVRTEYPFDTGVEYRVLNTSAAGTIQAATANGRISNVLGYVARVVDDGTVAGVPLRIDTYFAVTAPLHRFGDPLGMEHLYGAFFVGLFVDDLSRFLRDARSTPNTAAFALDRFGFIMGSSEERDFVTYTPTTAGTPTPLGCTSTAATGTLGLTSATYHVCRLHRTAYGHAQLAALPDSSLRAVEAHAEHREFDGGAAFLSSMAVSLAIGGFDIQLVLIIPEADVIGDVVQSRNVAIGIVSGLVVVAAVINFVIVALLLAPLGAIAERMHKAANLDDDAEDASVSAMAEVAELQEAYYAMNDELNRIRAFVPQSVLLEAKKNRQRNGSDDTGSDPGAHDAEETDLDLLASLSYGAMASTSGGGVGDESREFGASMENSHNRSQTRDPNAPRMSLSAPAGPEGLALARVSSTVNNGSSGNPRSGAKRSFVVPRSPLAAATKSPTGSVMSHKPAPGAAGKRQVGAYNLKAGMVTVLVANTTSFGPTVAAVGRDTAIAKTTELVELVNASIVANGGVVSSYHGDHFIATFNAAKPCGTHATSAARCAIAIRDQATSVGFSAPIRIGIATSRCLVGALGCKDVKAFHTIGPALQQACVLERMCRMNVFTQDESVALATRRTWHDVQTQLRGRVVDLVQLPASTAPTLLYKLATVVQHADADSNDIPKKGNDGTKKKDDGNDNEWLYLVGTAEASDPFKPWNDAWEALAQGRVDAAKERMACVDAQQPVPASSAPAHTPAPPAVTIDSGNNHGGEDDVDVGADDSAMSDAPGLKYLVERFDSLCAMSGDDRTGRHSDLGPFYSQGWIEGE